MLKVTTLERAELALSYLPCRLSREIKGLLGSRSGGLSEIREIRVRCGGLSSLIYKNEALPLLTRVGKEDMEETVRRLCDGSLYAYRDTVAEGYIPIGMGIRVGVCGRARYESRVASGIADISTLVVRIPGHGCEFSEELFSVWQGGVGSGMLIYSPPGVGKTTALRCLAEKIGSGREGVRVAVVDERCEFCKEDYDRCHVDILSGYRKREGIEIAARTMSPEVIMIDEVGGEDASAILGVVRCGVPIVATAHASSLEEVYSRSALTPLLDSGAFDVFVGISRTGTGYLLSVDRK